MYAFSWKTESDEGGGDFGRRAKRAAGNFEDKFRPRVELSSHGEIAVGFAAWIGGEAVGDFGLHDQVHFVDEIRERKQPMKNRRSDVVGKVAINAHAPARGGGGEIRFEDVTGDNRQLGKFLGETPETGDERRVKLDGVDRCACGEEMLGHFAMSGADFDPAEIFARPDGRYGVGRDADGARDLFAPVGVDKEMLAEALTSHGGNSVAGGGDRKER